MVKTEKKLHKKSRSGFTLLELLVVVGILAALVALALPFYQDYVNQSKITAAQADLQTYRKALAMYDQVENSSFTTANNLTPLIGKYLQDFRSFTGQVMPRDPWGNDYEYEVDSGAIWSRGPDGISGVAADARVISANADDLLVTWKPDFVIASARRINNTTLEVSFSRKVNTATLNTAAVTAPAGCTSVQKVSASIFRFIFPAVAGPTGTFTLAGTVAATDGRTLTQSGSTSVTYD